VHSLRRDLRCSFKLGGMEQLEFIVCEQCGRRLGYWYLQTPWGVARHVTCANCDTNVSPPASAVAREAEGDC
jgi:hypothetical protein